MIPSIFLSEPRIESCLEKLTKGKKVSYASVNIDTLKEQCDAHGEMVMAEHYLTDKERNIFIAYTYSKRKLEWLAGRIAAKKAAMKNCLLVPRVKFDKENEAWKHWEVAADASGRPFIVSRDGSPDISISHSGGIAIALAVKKGTCGIDIQRRSPRIVKVENRFVSLKEREFQKKCGCFAGLSKEVFLTLIWSAKEALRKGSGHKRVIGFLEMDLNSVICDQDHCFTFQFTCTRELDRGQKKNIFTTYQSICNDIVISFTM